MSLRSLALIVAALCAIASAPPHRAQAQSNAGKSPAKPAEKSRVSGKASGDGSTDPLAEIRRTTAVSLALALADEARSFRDPVLATRVQARAADALWEADNDRARTLFRRAWETADATDRENQRKMEEERRRQVEQTGAFAQINPSNLRAEVLRLAARRDRQLGEEFLAKLDEAKKQEDEDAARAADALSGLEAGQASQAASQRLRLASSLLDENEVERAMQFADPVLQNATMEGLNFLSRLRQKNAKAADDRYSAMLARAAMNPSTDANTISILGSYIFTPFLYVTVDAKGGINSSRMNNDDTRPDVPPALRNAFLNTAAQVFLRPLPQPEQDRTTSGRTGLYFIIARLLPLFDQYLPERSPALRAQMAALTQDVQEDVRTGKNEWLKEGFVPEEETASSNVKDALEAAEREQNPARRNQAYAQAALEAARQGDMRARDYTDKIDNTELRKSARTYVDYLLVSTALDKKDAEAAARLARTGDLTHIQRVWAYTESAKLLARPAAQRATELLEEALAEADRIGASSPDRARARVAIATATFQIDRARGWELTAEAIKASNSAEGFTGEDGRISAQFITQNSTSISSSSVSGFDVASIFASLALDDFSRAVELAKSFNSEAPRAAATLAALRTVLNVKKK